LPLDAAGLDALPLDAEPPGRPPDAGVAADVIAVADAETQHGADTGTTLETEVVKVQGDAARPSTCELTCASQNTRCDRACIDPSDQPVVGTTVYAFTLPSGAVDREWSYPASCQEAIQPTRLFHAEQYALSSYECCCLAPRAFRIEDNAGAPESCDAVCTASQRACHSNTYWASYGFAASLALYRRGGGGDFFAALGDCAVVPSLSRVREGVEEQLVAHECGCL
jgi:hypothetical protein